LERQRERGKRKAKEEKKKKKKRKKEKKKKRKRKKRKCFRRRRQARKRWRDKTQTGRKEKKVASPRGHPTTIRCRPKSEVTKIVVGIRSWELLDKKKRGRTPSKGPHKKGVKAGTLGQSLREIKAIVHARCCGQQNLRAGQKRLREF